MSTVTSCWQCLPAYCSLQWHWNPLMVVRQVPPFRHTLAEQVDTVLVSSPGPVVVGWPGTRVQ